MSLKSRVDRSLRHLPTHVVAALIRNRVTSDYQWGLLVACKTDAELLMVPGVGCATLPYFQMRREQAATAAAIEAHQRERETNTDRAWDRLEAQLAATGVQVRAQ